MNGQTRAARFARGIIASASRRFGGHTGLLLTALAWFVLSSPVQAQAPNSREWERILPVLSDLQADLRESRASGKPVLIFFSLTGCPFCLGALREALVPMYRDRNWNERLIFRQITIDHRQAVLDADGRSVRPIDIAERLGGRFAPTVMLLDPEGRKLGEPIVGVANFDLYAGMVEALAQQAIDTMKTRKSR